ncbi:MAG: DUF3883 domain-containing protein, partial [Chloroflexi bacterium]|nr:DUF3883 domain-containing protein [Chloroflexota bacterium]
YVERFFQRACRFLGIRLEKRQDGIWRIERLPYEVRNVPHSFKQRYGLLFDEYLRFSFDKAEARRAGAEFVAPGHPLLEAVIEALVARTAEALRRGATFVDPDGRYHGLLWFLEGEIRDGTNTIAGKRLFALYQPASEGGAAPLRPIPPAILWDLLPAPEPAAGDRPTLPPPDVVTRVALREVLEPYRRELLAQRERDAEIKRRYGLRSLKQQILESDAKLTDYEIRRAKGENIPEVTLQNERRKKEELLNRRERLKALIRQETTLALKPPRILGVAYVLPQPSPQEEMHRDPNVEAIAMREAIAYERTQGRTPEDVSTENLGYDLRSLSGGIPVRYIEVKGRAASGSIAMT